MRWKSPCVVLAAVLMGLAACAVEEAPTGPVLRAPRDGGDTEPSSDGGGTPPGPPKPTTPDAGDSGVEQPPEESGEATYYNAEGVGACGTQFPSDYLVAAINDEQYSKANCGRCVSVTGPKGTVVVRVLDKCPGCGPGDLDLSLTAFSKIADKSAGRVKITWHFVECAF